MSNVLTTKRNIIAFVAAILIAIAVSSSVAAASAFNFGFADENGVPNSHADAFIVKDAEINGNTVTITLRDASILGGLKVNGVQANRSAASDGNVEYTFTVADFDGLTDVELEVFAAPPHGGYMPMKLYWN
ncbi:hypothetical protein [Bacillus norwichensis]|uniref:Uncharacterized protein n=1 Tax=Bacillus norwichensis TaxID=2762217 RepID=A0ABR8VQ71_9BACI|nr:hypothetical protein [Bacillus norwichensis]MBD8006908.1 hypothetical protein [Bacillus norwichensis]